MVDVVSREQRRRDGGRTDSLVSASWASDYGERWFANWSTNPSISSVEEGACGRCIVVSGAALVAGLLVVSLTWTATS